MWTDSDPIRPAQVIPDFDVDKWHDWIDILFVIYFIWDLVICFKGMF